MMKKPKNTDAVSGPLIIPRGLRIKHVAQYVGATNWRVEEMLRKGELRFFWVGKAKVVDREDVDAWIEAQKELEEMKKVPVLTDAQAQAFFEGVQKDEVGNIILRFGSEED
jgi:excisionase family DNA binding protein